jgi:Fe2+ transport system protein FeoA
VKFAKINPFTQRKRPDCPDRLADAPPGCRVCMAGFSEEGVCWRERLQAYGVSPGSEIEVVQQSPVTVVRVDHVELAFERSVARDIIVRAPSSPGTE